MTKQAKQQLKHVRASLGLRQLDVAQKAGISEPAMIDIEKNRVHPRLTTAYAILNVLNAVLKERGRQELTIDSLTWTIQGEETIETATNIPQQADIEKPS